MWPALRHCEAGEAGIERETLPPCRTPQSGTERLLVVVRLGDFRESLNGDSAKIKLPSVNYRPLVESSTKAATAK